jgi:outer membrane lipoprotein carrier protein
LFSNYFNKRGTFRISLVLILLIAVFSFNAEEGGAATSTATDAETLLENFMHDAKTMRADFTQVVIDEEGRLDESATSSGVFLLQRPGKFRWQVTEPNDQLLIADGKNLWNYDVELEQATVKAIDASLSATPAMLLSGEDDVLEAFKVKSTFATIFADLPVQWLELEPVDTHNDFSKIRLGFSNNEIRLIELATNVGQVIRIEFSNVTRNLELDEKLFIFSAPDYVDVIGDAS